MDDAPASRTLIASLEPRQDGVLRKVGRFVGHFLSAITGGWDLSPDADLVVRRRSSGTEVHRTPERLLDEANNDLATLTEEEFLEEWSVSR
jgi:hypothetical protein